MVRIGPIRLKWTTLAMVALGVGGLWVLAPNLVNVALPFLLLALCPLTMIFMMRHGHQGSQEPACHAPQAKETAPQEHHRAEEATPVKTQQVSMAKETAELEPPGSQNGSQPIVR